MCWYIFSRINSLLGAQQKSVGRLEEGILVIRLRSDLYKQCS